MYVCMCVCEYMPAEKLPLSQIFISLAKAPHEFTVTVPPPYPTLSTPLVTEAIEEFTFAFDQFPFCLNRDLGLGRLWQGKEEYYHFLL